VEFRQYTLHPGARDVLIDLFEREFVESQEAVGIELIGQFRDLDAPNRFVWLRGYPDLATRVWALQAFYGGPVWADHREAANATMVDSSDVLLLRPARPTSGFSFGNGSRPAAGATELPAGLVVATIYHLDAHVGADFVDLFERRIEPALAYTGVAIAAYFVTESSENNFPALPVRAGENVFVWFSCFASPAAYEQHVAALAGSPRNGEISEALAGRVRGAPEVLRLAPTARSRLRG
jgi:hypothetical protein